MRYTIINNGTVFRTGECAKSMCDHQGVPFRADQEQIDLQAPEGMTAVMGWPDQSLGIDPELNVALGEELALTLPEGAVVQIGEQVTTMDDSGTMEITMATNGEYELRIAPPFPYQLYSGRVAVE